MTNELNLRQDGLPLFHSEDRLFFGRKENGDVIIIKKGVDAGGGFEEILFKQIIPNDIWCSAVASVSKLGEEQGRWYKATEFHNQDAPANIGTAGHQPTEQSKAQG